MADNKKWFKVWNSILTDPAMIDMEMADMGRWVMLGAILSLHGDNGVIVISKTSLSRLLRCENECIKTILNRLPNVQINDENCNGKITVSMLNWHKYQIDSTSYERVKKFRNAQNETMQEEKRIRREQEENKKIKDIFKNDDEFINALKDNSAYKHIDFTQELARMDAWLMTPKGKGRKKTRGFIVNWLNKIDKPIENSSLKNSLDVLVPEKPKIEPCKNPECVNGWIANGMRGEPARMCECKKRLQPTKPLPLQADIKGLISGIGRGMT